MAVRSAWLGARPHGRSRTRRGPTAGGVVAGALVLLVAGLPGASASSGAPGAAAWSPPPPGPSVASLDPEQQAVVLAPLRAAAAALDGAGRRTLPGSYAGVALDADAGRTELLLTDPTQAPALLVAARRTDPALDAQRVVVRRAAFPLAVLEAASRAALDATGTARAYAAHPAPDASGVVVEVADPAAATRATAGHPTAVPQTFVHGTPRSPHGWDAVKWHDSAPFIGGDVLTPDGHRYCTAGLPAVRVSDGRPVMVTAGHCFGVGQRVFTGAGPTWDYRNGRTGRFVGTVTRISRPWDAETLVGADDNADESDTAGWKPLTSVAYSYRGDYVCHSGARSASRGHPTPCGIEVTVADLYFREGGHRVRGVEGVDVHGWGSIGGDSGGTVFAVEPHGARQLRGMVSSGGEDGTDDQRRVDWPEAVDVFRAFGLELNPRR